MIGLMPLMLLTMFLVFKPKLKIKIETKQEIEKLNRNQYITIAIFATTALCWIFGTYLNEFISNILNINKIEEFDAVVAMTAAVLICVTNVASWKQVQDNTDWGVLMLFGGGLTLSAILKNSGADKAMVDAIVVLIEGKNYYLIGLLVATFIIFLTEFTSNTASAALLVPIFISIAEALNMNPLGLSLIIGLGASCAFMLPVATPPNAIAYGTGMVNQRDMIRAGFVLNVFSIIFISLIAYWFWF